jgi:murein DD-endopeptidase MepM/ murein hydrolase activator NlpD
MQRTGPIDQRRTSGQGVTEYALLIALIAIVVIVLVALVGNLLGDKLAVITEVLGSQCTPALQMVYADQHFSYGEPSSGSVSFIRPASGRISQGAWPCHRAIDIAAPTGTPIYAAAAGQVIKAGFTEYPGYGRLIVIRHADGYQTVYAHLSESYVHEGEYVSRGEMIGRIGSTGRSTGPHLHFEVAKDTWLLDPLDVLP